MKILIAKALNYAASKTSTTTETAKNPKDLKEGSIGIYGVHTFTISSVKYERLALITETATTTASLPTDGLWVVNVDDFNGKEIIIARGTIDGYVASNPIQLKAIESLVGAEYAAPVAMSVTVGYTTDGGRLNLPTTIEERDSAMVKLIKSLEGTNTDDRKSYDAVLSATDTQYSILTKVIAKLDALNDNGEQAFAYGEIVSDGTRTAIAAGSGDSTSIVVVNGSTTVAFNNAGIQTALTVGAFVKIQGVLYKIVTSETTGFTIDRAYSGASETIAFSDADTGVYSAITQHGLKLTNRVAGDKVEVALGGVLEDATITYATQGTPGSGTSAQVLGIEKESFGERGNYDRIKSYMPQIPTHTVTDEVYDLYFMKYSNQFDGKSEVSDKFNNNGSVFIAFPDGDYNDSGEGQGIFETIFTTLKTAGKISGSVSVGIAGA